MKENGFALKKKKKKKKKRSKRYPTENMTDEDNTDYLAFLKNAQALTGFLVHHLEQTARGIGLYVIADKIEFIYFNQDYAISVHAKPLKLLTTVHILR